MSKIDRMIHPKVIYHMKLLISDEYNIRVELNIYKTNDKIQQHSQECKRHVERMSPISIVKHHIYRSQCKRDIGRPMIWHE